MKKDTEILSGPLLSFDTALNACSVALTDAHGAVFAERVEPMQRGQSEALIPTIEEVLRHAGLAYRDLAALATTRGPGAFTGVRLGLAAAQALELSLKIPAYGVSTLEVLAFAHSQRDAPQGDFAICLETKRTEYYLQLFNKSGAAINKPASVPLSDVEELCAPLSRIIGDALERLRTEWSDAPDSLSFIEYKHIPPTAIADFIRARQNNLSDFPLRPLYLRGADVSPPKSSYGLEAVRK